MGCLNRGERLQEKLSDHNVATRFQGNRTLWNLHQNLKHHLIARRVGHDDSIAVGDSDDQLLTIDRLAFLIGAG